MSIAIDIRRGRASTRTPRAVVVERALSTDQQLQATRGFLRHVVLAFMSVTAIVYAAAAAGLTV